MQLILCSKPDGIQNFVQMKSWQVYFNKTQGKKRNIIWKKLKKRARYLHINRKQEQANFGPNVFKEPDLDVQIVN